MASKTSQVLRSLARELKAVYKQENLHDVPAYAYLHEQLRNFEVTGEKICRAQHEVEHVAQTYLCYLESTRKQESENSIVAVCPAKSMKTTLSSVYFGVGSEMADETNPSAEKSVDIGAKKELSAQYKGKGERSIESSAGIVGLKLPKLYSEDPHSEDK